MIYDLNSIPKPIVVFQIPADLDQGESLTERTDIFRFFLTFVNLKGLLQQYKMTFCFCKRLVYPKH